jgi:hypothetical protein
VVVYEVVEWLLGFIVDTVGMDLGVSVGALALVVVGIYYSREIARFLGGLARWVRVLSVVIGVIAAITVVGVTTGAISLESGIVPKIVEVLGAVAGHV